MLMLGFVVWFSGDEFLSMKFQDDASDSISDTLHCIVELSRICCATFNHAFAGQSSKHRQKQQLRV